MDSLAHFLVLNLGLLSVHLSFELYPVSDILSKFVICSLLHGFTVELEVLVAWVLDLLKATFRVVPS